VIQLVWRTVRFTKGRAVALAAGPLVLPAGSAQTGTQKRVVQVNYLSTATDGITLAQYRRIARLPGVSVAAPLATLGYVVDDASVPVTLTPGHLHVPVGRADLVLPVAILLALLSGLVPSWHAARIPPASALTPPARAPRSRGRRIRTVTGLAAVLLTIALSAVGIADVTYLNLRERAAELAALAASGWSRPQLGRLLATESVLTAVLGSVAGGAVGLGIAGYAFGLSGLVVAVTIAAAAGGTAVALIATIAVLIFSTGRPLAAVLAADD